MKTGFEISHGVLRFSVELRTLDGDTHSFVSDHPETFAAVCRDMVLPMENVLAEWCRAIAQQQEDE